MQRIAGLLEGRGNNAQEGPIDCRTVAPLQTAEELPACFVGLIASHFRRCGVGGEGGHVLAIDPIGECLIVVEALGGERVMVALE